MTESLEERFRLQYYGRDRDFLAITWAFDHEGYVPGNCYVRAIRSETDFAEHDDFPYTEPMTLAEARVIIYENKGMLGSMIHDCIGLKLEDTLKGSVIFLEPITIRNQTARHMYD